MHRKKIDNSDLPAAQADLEDMTLLSPITLMIIDKARFAPGGVCTLYYDGAKSFFRQTEPHEVI